MTLCADVIRGKSSADIPSAESNQKLQVSIGYFMLYRLLIAVSSVEPRHHGQDLEARISYDNKLLRSEPLHTLTFPTCALKSASLYPKALCSAMYLGR